MAHPLVFGRQLSASSKLFHHKLTMAGSGPWNYDRVWDFADCPVLSAGALIPDIMTKQAVRMDNCTDTFSCRSLSILKLFFMLAAK